MLQEALIGKQIPMKTDGVGKTKWARILLFTLQMNINC